MSEINEPNCFHLLKAQGQQPSLNSTVYDHFTCVIMWILILKTLPQDRHYTYF